MGNFFSNLLPAIDSKTQQLVNNIRSSSPVQGLLNSPVGAVIQGQPSQVLPRITQNLNTQGQVMQHAGDASYKRQHGQTPTAQDLANEKAGINQSVNMAVAGSTGIGNPESGIVDKFGNPIPSTPKLPNPPEQPTEMGSYKFSDKTAAAKGAKYTNPTMTPNTNPEGAHYTTNSPEIPEATTSQPAIPKPPVTQDVPPVVKPTPQGPQRTFPIENANPSKDDISASIKRNIPIDGHDVKTPNDVAQVNSTLNGYGIKGPMTQQLQMANDTIGTLANKAKNIVATEGGVVPKNSIVADTTKNLSYSPNHNILPQNAFKTANDYIDNLYARAKGNNVTQGITGTTPDDIPGTVLQDMKTIANQDAQSTFDKTDPTKWTTPQIVSRYARDAIDTALDTKYPKASTLNNDMSDLYKAQDGLRKGANQEGVAAQKAINTPPQPSDPMSYIGGKALDYFPGGKIVHKAGNAALTNPTGQKILGGGALVGGTIGAMKLLPNIENSFNKQNTTNAQGNSGSQQGNEGNIGGTHSGIITQGSNPDGSFTTSSIPQNLGDTKLNPDGSVYVPSPSQIKDNTGNTIGVDPNSYNKQVKTLQDDIAKQHKIAAADPYTPGTQTTTAQTIAADNAQIEALKTLNDSSTGLNNGYKYVATVTGKTNTALKTLNSTSPNLSDLNSQINDLQNNLDPAYAGLKQQLLGISKDIGGGNLDVKTKGALQSVLKQINQQTAYDYYQAINAYSASSPTSTTSQNYTPQSSPEAPATPQNFGNITGGSVPNQLPPIQ